MCKRTDIHAPSSADFDPAKYEFVDCFDNNPEWVANDWFAVSHDLIERGYKLGNGSSFNCGHCGANIRYFALLIREDVKEFICVGQQCLSNRFRDLTAAKFQDLRKRASLNRERATRLERVKSLKESNPAIARLLDGNDVEVNRSEFLSDIRRKAEDSGRLSEAQIAAVGKAFERIDQRKAWDKERAEKAAVLVAAGVKAPEGRLEFEGVIVSAKIHDSRFGESVKLVVKTDAGWSVWVTCPSGLEDAAVGHVDIGLPSGGARAYEALRGRRVRLTATLTRSDRDPLFAFGKRPAKASLLDAAEQPA